MLLINCESFSMSLFFVQCQIQRPSIMRISTQTNLVTQSKLTIKCVSHPAKIRSKIESYAIQWTHSVSWKSLYSRRSFKEKNSSRFKFSYLKCHTFRLPTSPVIKAFFDGIYCILEFARVSYKILLSQIKITSKLV